MINNDESNKWLKQDPSYADSYLKGADIILVERSRTIKILIDLFRYHFKDRKNLNLLDMGCGDGILTMYIRGRYPDNNFFLMDGSADMLNRAKEKISGANISYRQQTFEEYCNSPDEEEKYNFIYSANAIHHLDLDGKARLFSKIYREMQPGGLFIDIDPVKPNSEKSEQWQFKMWTDWINETLSKSGLTKDIGKYDNLTTGYKAKRENKPSTLFEQCDLLSKTGFRDVDCFYKYGVFAVFGGTKPN